METKKEHGTAHVGDAPENETTNETTQQPVDMTTRLDELEAENKKLKKAFDDEKKACMRYYRQMTIQKNALLKLVEGGKVTQEDIMKAVVDGQGFTDFDALVFFMSNQ